MKDDAPPSDESLMLAYRDGDSAAFDALFRRHKGGLYRFLRRQCESAAVAEELFQEVWMNLVRARRRYTPQARFATYLYRIAHNRLIDHYRRGAARPSSLGRDDESEDDPVDLIAADPRGEPEQLVLSRQQIERFAEVLAALPPMQREAFVMHEEGGLSVEEIAQVTDVNAETAKSRLRYAIAKLRRGLEEFR